MDIPMQTVAGDPAAPLARRFRSAAGEHLLVVPFSRIFDLSSEAPAALDLTDPVITALKEPGAGEISLDRIDEPSPQSLSLNVSSSCNLGCTYCYAARGGFNGAQQAPMTWETACAAIDRLLAIAESTQSG